MRRRTVLSAAGISLTAGCLRLATEEELQSETGETTERVETPGPIERNEGDIPFELDHIDGVEAQMDFGWESDRLQFSLGAADPDPDAHPDELVQAELGFVSEQVDLSPVDRILYRFHHVSEPGDGVHEADADQDTSYFAVMSDTSALRYQPLREDNLTDGGFDGIDRSVFLKNHADTGEITRVVDVADVTEPRFVGVGGNVGSETAEILRLSVLEITGVDSDDNFVFGLNPETRALATDPSTVPDI